jgi:hypothetical protein
MAEDADGQDMWDRSVAGEGPHDMYICETIAEGIEMTECDKESEWRMVAMLVTSGVIEINIIQCGSPPRGRLPHSVNGGGDGGRGSPAWTRRVLDNHNQRVTGVGEAGFGQSPPERQILSASPLYCSF